VRLDLKRGTMRVTVPRRRDPVRPIAITRPVYSSTGLHLGDVVTSGLVYESILEPRHVEAIGEATKISSRLGLDLEVVEESFISRLGKVASRLTAQ